MQHLPRTLHVASKVKSKARACRLHLAELLGVGKLEPFGVYNTLPQILHKKLQGSLHSPGFRLGSILSLVCYSPIWNGDVCCCISEMCVTCLCWRYLQILKSLRSQGDSDLRTWPVMKWVRTTDRINRVDLNARLCCGVEASPVEVRCRPYDLDTK